MLTNGEIELCQRFAGTACGLLRERRCAVFCFLFVVALGHVQSEAADLDARKQGIVECSASVRSHHNPGLAGKIDHEVCFEGYISNFNKGSHPDDRGRLKHVAVPHWVIHRVDAAKKAPEARERPRAWFTVPDLMQDNIAPTDDSYHFSQAFLDRHRNWYQRGHLAQKYLAERIGADAGWFTHNVANAVPQRGRFNMGPWLALECHTGAWANKYKRIWVISGPIFTNGHPRTWLRSNRYRDALPVAIPDELFKIVIRRNSANGVDTLAFIYPQDHVSYRKGPWPPATWLVSIARIEELTRAEFLSALSQSDKDKIATAVWPVALKDFDPSCRRFAEKDR